MSSAYGGRHSGLRFYAGTDPYAGRDHGGFQAVSSDLYAGASLSFLLQYCHRDFSAMGDSRTPFVFLAFSSIANILVDYLLYGSWQWELQAWHGLLFCVRA